MVTIGTKLVKDNKIYEVIEMGAWGFKLARKTGENLVYSNVEMNIELKEGNIQELISLMKYTLDDLKQKTLNGESGLYTSINEEGQDVIVEMNNYCLEIDTFQDNGWIRKNVYEWDGSFWIRSEIYEGKWK